MASKQRVSCSLGVWLPALLLLLVQLAATLNADCPHECIPLTDCPELLKLLENPSPEQVKALQDVTCAIRGRTPTVCCPEVTTPAPTGLLPEKCGEGPSINKIHGGTKAEIDAYPWMAVFGYSDVGSTAVEFLCGGAVISERYVLTAAHCVHPSLLNTRPLEVIRLGEWNLRTEEDCDTTLKGFTVCIPPAQNFTYEEITIHPDYNTRRRFSDDIALVRLSRPVDLSGQSIKPVCLPAQGLEPRTVLGERQAVVAGWGITENGTTSDTLLNVFLPIADHGECNRTYNGIVLDEQLCFGGLAGQDSCKGDSGGPLMLSGPRGPPFQHIGVVSYGPVPCGRENKPGVYTSTSHYRNWIEQNLKP